MAGATTPGSEELLLTLELPGGGHLAIGLYDHGYLLGVFDAEGEPVATGEATTWEAVLELAIDYVDPLEAAFDHSPSDLSVSTGGFDTGTGIELLFKTGEGEWVVCLHDYDGPEVLDEEEEAVVWEFDSLRSYLLDLAEGAADFGLDQTVGGPRRTASAEQLSRPSEQAWIVIGDAASWPTDDELAAQRALSAAGQLGEVWTAAKQTEPGDLLVVYFMAPRKAACFVARAQTEAFYDPHIGVNSVGSPSNHQWWVHHSPLVRIEPISFADLRDAVGGHLILRGRSGKFVRPEVVAALPFVAHDPDDQSFVDQLTQRPTGLADLPNPETMTVSDIAALAPGALRLESDVSAYVVKPTLRHALADSGLTVHAEYPVGRRRADFVVLDGDTPKCVVEVKLRAIAPTTDSSPDVVQTVDYATSLGCAAILIDSSEFHLIEPGQQSVSTSGSRQELDVLLDTITNHIVGQ